MTHTEASKVTTFCLVSAVTGFIVGIMLTICLFSLTAKHSIDFADRINYPVEHSKIVKS